MNIQISLQAMLGTGTALIFAILTHAVIACEWGKYGDDCDKRCPPNCQVNPQRNLTHCNKDTGECSDGCITGWYASQCDQPCSKNCPDNVCIQQNGRCAKECSGNQRGDFCAITKDIKVKTDETTGLSTAHVAVIITISLVAIIVIIVVTVVLKRRRQTDNRRRLTGRPTAGTDPENPEDVPLLPIKVHGNSNDRTKNEYKGVMERDMLKKRIKETEACFEETAIYNKVKEHLENFRYVTIAGASGEGKTSMALMLGSEYQKKGYELYFVDSISKFELSAVSQDKDRCFIFDDIFGTVEISTDPTQLRRILDKLNFYLEQRACYVAEKYPLHSNHQKKDMGNICIIFTTKSYNLGQGLSHLGTRDDVFFKGTSVIDLTQSNSRYTMKEKKRIFIKHKEYNKNSHDFDLEKICGIDDKIFGFPLTCTLFFSFPKSHDQYEAFFKAPLRYLRKDLEWLLTRGNNKSAALILMLLCEGNLNLSELEVKSNNQVLENHLSSVSDIVHGFNRTEVAKGVRHFFGTYFTRGDITSFSHPAIYDACAFVLYEINHAFVLEHCSIQFLYERVQAQTAPACESDDDRHVIYVPDAYNDIIASRLAGAVMERNYRMSIMHRILERQDILDKVLGKLKLLMFDESLEDEYDNTIFHYACFSGNVNLVTKLIPFCDINTKGTNGVTPIMIAVLLGLEALFKLLNSKGADLTLTNDCNDTVLHLACEVGNRSIVEDLLPSFDINSRGRLAQTALMKAAFSAKEDVVDLLVSEGADLTLTDDYNDTVLHLACVGGNRSIVEYLLPLFDINSRGQHGLTAVMAASLSAKKDVFDLFVSKGADLTLTDEYNNSLLHTACRGGNRSIVEYILPMFDINSRGKRGWTAVMKAALYRNKDTFDLLVSRRADLTLTDEDNDTVLHYACEGGNRSIVEYLLPLFDINSRGKHGLTAVMKAAFNTKKDVLDLLVSKGADLTLTDDDNDTVLHLACQVGNRSIVEHLLPMFDINSRGHHGWTAVMRAAVCAKKDVFDLLVSRRADLTLTDDDNDTVLHYACKGGNRSIVEYLLPLFDINSRGQHGLTAVMIAAFIAKKNTFDLLVSKGADLTLAYENKDTVLHLACQGGNRSIVEYLLQSFDINSRGQQGRTAVMSAALCAKKDVVDLLVSKGADLTLTDDDNDTVLHLACRFGNRSIAEHLLPLFDINGRGQYGLTAVMFAALCAKTDIVDLLVSKGADLTLKNVCNDTVLHLACEVGNRSIVEHLLPSFDINSRGQNGRTAVMVAAENAKKDVFELLVSKGADLTLTDHHNDNVLQLSCQGGNLLIVEHLLPMFDINCRGYKGCTPVMKGAYFGKKDTFDLLLSKGANPSLTGDNNETLLHAASRGGNIHIVRHVIDDFDINTRGGNGHTPLMRAVSGGHTDVVDFLVDHGADVHIADNDGDSLLHLACEVGNLTMVKHVVSYVDINLRNNLGWTPLTAAYVEGASRGGNIHIVRHVIDDFDINTRGGNGHTPLMRAVCGGHTDVVDFLVDHGADVHMADNDGDSLLHLASEVGNLTMVKHVVSYVDINLRSNLGWTPLTAASVVGALAVFKFLKGLGADLTLTDRTGDDVYTLALQGGCRGIIKELVGEEHSDKSITPWNQLMKSLVTSQMFYLNTHSQQSPALVQTDQFGDSLLHLACRGGNKQCVEYLLPSYDINVRGRYDWTPVMMAAVCGHQDVFQLLVSHKANLSLVSNTGEGVTTLARRGNNDDIIKYLLTHS